MLTALRCANSTLEIWSQCGSKMVEVGCVCVSTPVSKDTTLAISIPMTFQTLYSSRGTGADLPIQSNEAVAFRWMSGLINHLYLHNF